MKKEKIIGEKMVIRECKKWEKRNKLVAKLLKKKIKGVLIIPRFN